MCSDTNPDTWKKPLKISIIKECQKKQIIVPFDHRQVTHRRPPSSVCPESATIKFTNFTTLRLPAENARSRSKRAGSQKETALNAEELQTEILRPHFTPQLIRERYHVGHNAKPQETNEKNGQMTTWNGPTRQYWTWSGGQSTDWHIKDSLYEVAHARESGTAP